MHSDEFWWQKLEKLVRDRIPEIIQSQGRSPTFRIAPPEELDFLLREKVIEEAKELMQSGDAEEIIDILEVVDALIILRGLDTADLERRKAQKRIQRGGFTKGYVLKE